MLRLNQKVSIKKVVLIIIASCLVCSLLTAAVFASSPLTFQVITSGVVSGAPTYTVFIDNAIYYAKNAYGAISYSDTDFESLIENINTANNHADILLLNGIYIISDELNISPYLTLRGESMGKRDYTATIKATDTFPEGSALIHIESEVSNLGYRLGMLNNLWLYNPYPTRNIEGIVLQADASSSSVISGYTIQNIASNYVSSTIHFKGWITRCSGNNIQVSSLNNDFFGTNCFWLEKTGSALEGPYMNIISDVKVIGPGQTGTSGYKNVILFGNDSKYNQFTNFCFDNIVLLDSFVQFQGENTLANQLINLRCSDTYSLGGSSIYTASAILFNGSGVRDNKIFAGIIAAPGYENHDLIRYINNPFNNYVQCEVFGGGRYGSYCINGTGAGAGNIVEFLPNNCGETSSYQTNAVWKYTGTSEIITFKGYQAETKGSITGASNGEVLTFLDPLANTPTHLIFSTNNSGVYAAYSAASRFNVTLALVNVSDGSAYSGGAVTVYCQAWYNP